MIHIDRSGSLLAGSKGSIPLRDDDEITLKLVLLFEGQCEGLGTSKAAEKFWIDKTALLKILQQFKLHGAQALLSANGVRKAITEEVLRWCVK